MAAVVTRVAAALIAATEVAGSDAGKKKKRAIREELNLQQARVRL